MDRQRRLDSLLLSRATEGLTPAQERELERLLAAIPDVDAGAYERAAALVCLAVHGRRRGLPSRVRDALATHAGDVAAKK